MDNFGIRLLQEKCMFACNLKALFGGSKLFDKIHSLSKRHVPSPKDRLSTPLIYFGNSYNVGEKNLQPVQGVGSSTISRTCIRGETNFGIVIAQGSS